MELEEKLSPTEAARILASLRPVKQVTCAYCGQVGEGRGRRKYCKPTHRDMAYQRRRREGQRAKKSADVTPEGGPEVGGPPAE